MGASAVTTVYLLLAVAVGLVLLLVVALPNLRGGQASRRSTRGERRGSSRTGRSRSGSAEERAPRPRD